MTGWLERAVEESYDALFALFSDLHRHPELGFAEYRTTARVVESLTEAGWAVRTSPDVTGAVGVLAGGPGPVVAVRADIDALPIGERTGLPYSSEHGGSAGAMHACGHDIHTAGLVGLARLLARQRDRWSGTVILIAQPAEELGEGARRLIGAGLLDGLPTPDVVLAHHVGHIEGEALFGSRTGVYEAGQRNWRVRVRGTGGHAAAPHRARNPLAVVSQLALRSQSLVGVSVDAGEQSVLVPTTVHADAGTNVIPAEASATFCARAFSVDALDTLETAFRRLVQGIAASEGLDDDAVDIDRFNIFPVNDNDSATLERAARALRTEFGPDAYRETPRLLGSEDFGEFATHWSAPSAYWHFDAGVSPLAADPDAARRGHSPTFAPDPGVALRRATRALTAVTLEFLGDPEPRAPAEKHRDRASVR